MQAFDLACGERSEDDLYKGLTRLPYRPPCFDMRQERIRRNPLGGIGEIFHVSCYYFFPEPAFQSRVSVQ
jgi:hypothetical protein